jgi:putative Mg2+ transporter-C (MgtC) family protein
VRVTYRDGEGVLRAILELATQSGYAVEHAVTERQALDAVDEPGRTPPRTRSLIDLRMRLVGPRKINELLAVLAEQSGISSVETGEIDDTSE